MTPKNYLVAKKVIGVSFTNLLYFYFMLQLFEDIVDLLDPEMNMASDDEDEDDDDLDSVGDGRQTQQANRRPSSVFDVPQTQQGEESSKPSE